MMALAALSLTLASCSQNLESKAKEYVDQEIEAMVAGDFQKAMQIAKEMESFANTLSEEDKQVFMEAMQTYTEEHKAEIEQAMTGTLKNTLQNGVNSLKDAFKK